MIQLTITAPTFKKLKPGNKKHQRKCALKVLEEASEFAEDAKTCAKFPETDAFRQSMAYELADLMQAIINCVYVFELETEELRAAINQVTATNEDRGRY